MRKLWMQDSMCGSRRIVINTVNMGTNLMKKIKGTGIPGVVCLNIRCWSCGKCEHKRSDCPTSKKAD